MPEYSQLHVLIADNELPTHEHLRDLLASRLEVGDIIQARNSREAVRALKTEDPDLVFLNPEMLTMSDIEVVKKYGPDAMPVTIFIAAHGDRATEAFDPAAVDCMLKPFDEERFATAFERGLQAVRLAHMKKLTERFQELLDLYREMRAGEGLSTNGTPTTEEETGEHLERITVEARNQIHVVPVEDIRYVTAEDKYVKVYTSEESYLLRERMYEMEKHLDPAQFARVHRSTIVRLDCIERLVQRSENDYFVQLDDAKQFRVSRSRQDDLVQRLKTGKVT